MSPEQPLQQSKAAGWDSQGLGGCLHSSGQRNRAETAAMLRHRQGQGGSLGWRGAHSDSPETPSQVPAALTTPKGAGEGHHGHRTGALPSPATICCSGRNQDTTLTALDAHGSHLTSLPTRQSRGGPLLLGAAPLSMSNSGKATQLIRVQ